MYCKLICLDLKLISRKTNIRNSYNSILFESFTDNDYTVTLVRPSFVDGDSWVVPDCALGDASVTDSLLYLQNNLTTFLKVSNSECLHGYSSPLVSQWGNALLVTDPGAGNPVLMAFPSRKLDDQNGFIKCYENTGHEIVPHGLTPICEMPYLLDHPDQLLYRGCKEDPTIPENYVVVDFPVDHCLVQQVQEKCTVLMSLTILSVVAACNLIKLICMLSVLRLRNFNPLVTIGDAIASFLDEEDHSTAQCGLFSVNERQAWRTGSLQQSRAYIRQRRWLEGVSRKRFVVSSCLYATLF
jgi:hypothetical protein